MIIETPSPDDLRRIRERLGLSQRELADALGFTPNGTATIRAWETGERDGTPFRPTPLAVMALRYLDALVLVYNQIPYDDPISQEKIRTVLPESLR
jgi:transcriptional regulator with XRE-family HTH domain